MKFPAHISLQRKLFITLAFGFAGFLMYFAANFTLSRHNQELMAELMTHRLPSLEATENLVRAMGSVRAGVVQSAFSGNLDSLTQLEDGHREVLAAFDQVARHSNIPDLEHSRQRFEQTYKAVSEVLQNVVAGLEKLDHVQHQIQQSSAELALLEKWTVDLKAHQVEAFRDTIESVNSGSRATIWAGWALVFGGVPFGIFFWWLTRGATSGLQDLSNRLAEVSRNMLKISSETSASSGKLASFSGQQSTSVLESVSSMDEMKAKLTQTVRHTADALRSSEDNFREASDGKIVIEGLRNAMHDIERSYQALEEVNEVVRRIHDKTNIINDIVFKTQLLSFNASIEAARAGQHGRGFAVVASEVGKLAEMSGQAAHEIGKLLDHSTQKVAEIVGSTKDKVASANEMSERCAKVFEGITARAGLVKAMVNSITDAASEQETGIHLVVRAMTDMSDSVVETDKMAHAIAQLSMVLRGHSETLATTIQRLDGIVHGARPEESSSRPHSQLEAVVDDSEDYAESA
jgi:hypothetical protein